MGALAAAREMKKTTVELIEGFLPLCVEGQQDHRALDVGPLPTFDWSHSHLHVHPHRCFGHIVVVGKDWERDELLGEWTGRTLCSAR